LTGFVDFRQNLLTLFLKFNIHFIFTHILELWGTFYVQKSRDDALQMAEVMEISFPSSTSEGKMRVVPEKSTFRSYLLSVVPVGCVTFLQFNALMLSFSNCYLYKGWVVK
jgi:hypothetical protein